MISLQSDEVTGWYGKLPTLGDFASRRLAPAFLEHWDEWLAAGLAAWRAQEPDRWVEGYLACPSWRFVLMPGVLPAPSASATGAWAGVLMPSVDRVGRYFPLTLVRSLTALPADHGQLDALLRWLQELDDVAVDALQDDWSVERLDAELAGMGTWTAPARDRPANASVDWDTATSCEVLPASVADWLAEASSEAMQRSLHGKALWLSTDAAGHPLLRITEGLPPAAEFANLLARGSDLTIPNPL